MKYQTVFFEPSCCFTAMLAATCCLGALRAQTPRPSRAPYAATISLEAKVGSVPQTIAVTDASNNVASVMVGVESFGDIRIVDGRIYVCGRKDVDGQPRGILSVVEQNGSGTWVEIGVYVETGSDFTGVAYDGAGARVHLLDGLKKRVISAPFAAAPGTPPPTTTWTTSFGVTQVAPLSSSLEMKLGFSQVGVRSAYVLTYAVPHKDAFLVDSATLVVSAYQGVTGRLVVASDERLVSGATVINVLGPPNVPYDVVRLDTLDLLASGITDGIGIDSVSMPPAVMGGVYVVKSHIFDRFVALRTPGKFWGSSDALPTGHRVAEFFDDPGLLSFVGSQHMGAVLSANPGVPIGNFPANYSVALVVGVEADILVTPTQKYLLNGQVLPADNLVLEAGEFGYSTKALPVPNDPALAGAEYCLQWWVVVAAGDVRCSNIKGVVIRDAEFEHWNVPTSARASKRGKGQPRVDNAEALKARGAALRRWLGSLKGVRLAGEEFRKLHGL